MDEEFLKELIMNGEFSWEKIETGNASPRMVAKFKYKNYCVSTIMSNDQIQDLLFYGYKASSIEEELKSTLIREMANNTTIKRDFKINNILDTDGTLVQLENQIQILKTGDIKNNEFH